MRKLISGSAGFSILLCDIWKDTFERFLNVFLHHGSVSHPEVRLLGHSDKEPRVDHAGNHLDRAVDIIEVGFGRSFEEPVEQEVAVVGHARTRLRHCHPQLQLAPEKLLDSGFDGNVRHRRDFNRNLLVAEREELGVLCVVRDDDQIFGAGSDNLLLFNQNKSDIRIWLDVRKCLNFFTHRF